MCAAWGPGHLLLLAAALAYHLINRGFHKARADPFAVPVALAIVGNEAFIVRNVGGIPPRLSAVCVRWHGHRLLWRRRGPS